VKFNDSCEIRTVHEKPLGHVHAVDFFLGCNVLIKWGLLDRSTARYFYKRLKSSLHKPTGIILENLFSTKCAFKNNLQLLEKKVFVSNEYTP
jgi:hypothetical protein